MKTLKITLVLAVLFTSLYSCVEQDLNEDDLLVNTEEPTDIPMPPTGGSSQDN